MVYVLILGVECVLIAIASALWFGESFSTKEIFGGALIVAGTAIAWS
jgi:multidrug transporter EmrE-like cation transporter